MMGLRIASVAIVAAGLLAPGAAHAQSYPTKPVKLIVPFAAGGAIGTRAAAAAEPDGHTLLIGSVTTLATGPLSPRTSVTIRARISSRLRSWRARRSRWW
jgi:tripartite-type tricarboxylate transporter receptor subunit TctC